MPSSVSRVGANNGGADKTELFLKKFAGEVLTTFETNAVFKPLHLVRTIENGKSASFPVTGTANAKYHSPGDNLLISEFNTNQPYLSTIAHTEKVITIDNLLTSSALIAKIDEAMNHYDVRSIYTEEIGRALAKKFDRTIAQIVVNAARSGVNITGATNAAGNPLAGQVQTFTGSPTTFGALTGAQVAEAILNASVKLDQNDVPDDGERYCVVSPETYAKLVATTSAVATQVSGERAYNVGSYADGTIVKVGNVKIIKSNNLPTAANGNYSIETNSRVNYGWPTSTQDGLTGVASGYSKVAGVVFHKNAAGTVKLLDLAVESEYKIELQGTFMVAKYAMGHGVLRPECSVELRLST
jgi:hypothetical protein